MIGWKSRTGGIQRRALEMTGAYDGGLAAATHGLVAGTRIASNLGWRAVEALAVGDQVLTFDNAMQEIVEIRRSSVWLDAPETAPALWPVVIPSGALGNRDELVLLADQGVLVESDAAQDLYGDPFAIVAAAALDGVRGIYRAPPMQQIELISITFADEQVIYAEGGALIHCPAAVSALDRLLEGSVPCYDVLAQTEAAFVVESMIIEDRMLASGGHGHIQAAHY